MITFGELKAGDEFIYDNILYTKISGNFADSEFGSTDEIPATAKVQLVNNYES